MTVPLVIFVYRDECVHPTSKGLKYGYDSVSPFEWTGAIREIIKTYLRCQLSSSPPYDFEANALTA